MNAGTPISQYQKATAIPDETLYIAEMGDGSGTKVVTQETLTKEVGKGLKVGNLEDLQTKNKENLVAAINEAAQSGSGGSAVDILDTKEEIEANTEAGKAAGAQAVKEMFGALNDNLQGFTPVIDETTGKMTGYKTAKGGADTVFPFSGNSGGLELLWENPNPSALSNTVIADCNYSDYQYLVVNLKEGANNAIASHTQIIQPNITTSIPNIGLSMGYSRSISYGDNQISFTTNAPGASGGSYTLPVRIYGVVDIGSQPYLGYS